MWKKVLRYKELSAVNFLMSFRLKFRAGPLLQLTWKDVDSIKKTGELQTDRHKTGITMLPLLLKRIIINSSKD